MELRDNISERRRAAKLTQEDVATILGVSRQTVGKWESGKATPELDKLISLCDLLGCSLDELVGRTEAKASSEAEDTAPADDIQDCNSLNAEPDVPVRVRLEADQPPSDTTVTRYVTILAAGIWLLAASFGLLTLLFGPSSVDNMEVRRIVPYAVLLGMAFGVGLIVVVQVNRSRCMKNGATSTLSARRCRIAAAVSLAVIASAICAIASLAPGMRTTAFICVEVLALAAWPITIAVILTIDARR